MLAIASTPADNNYFHVDDFDALYGILRSIVDEVCLFDLTTYPTIGRSLPYINMGSYMFHLREC